MYLFSPLRLKSCPLDADLGNFDILLLEQGQENFNNSSTSNEWARVSVDRKHKQKEGCAYLGTVENALLCSSVLSPNNRNILRRAIESNFQKIISGIPCSNYTELENSKKVRQEEK